MVALGRGKDILVIVVNCFVEQVAGSSGRTIGARNLMRAGLRLNALHQGKQQQQPAIKYSQSSIPFRIMDVSQEK